MKSHFCIDDFLVGAIMTNPVIMKSYDSYEIHTIIITSLEDFNNNLVAMGFIQIFNNLSGERQIAKSIFSEHEQMKGIIDELRENKMLDDPPDDSPI